ncbi:MAG TPA: hypothetical protein VGN35_07475 [Jatrophihabitantaceae bacterium]|nr:hypothetical protein [Jatrophihabitantaceae bacterium]
MALTAIPETNNHFARGGPARAGFVAENHGNVDADGVITFQLPSDVSLQKAELVTAATSTPVNCTSTGTPGQFECELGVVHAGACCDRQIDIDVLIAPDATIGPQVVTATLSSPVGPDPNPSDNTASYTFLATGTSHFQYALTGPVIPAGRTAQFVLTVRNTGPDAAPNVTVVLSQPISTHFSYAHPTFDFVTFDSPDVSPGGNSMDWTLPHTLQPGEQVQLTMTLTASGVDQVGTMRVSENSDSAGTCGRYPDPGGDCGTTFTLHATALAKTSTSPSPSGPTLAETGKPNNAIGETGVAAILLGLLLLAAARRRTPSHGR